MLSEKHALTPHPYLHLPGSACFSENISCSPQKRHEQGISGDHGGRLKMAPEAKSKEERATKNIGEKNKKE